MASKLVNASGSCAFTVLDPVKFLSGTQGCHKIANFIIPDDYVTYQWAEKPRKNHRTTAGGFEKFKHGDLCGSETCNNGATKYKCKRKTFKSECWEQLEKNFPQAMYKAARPRKACPMDVYVLMKKSAER